LKAAPAILSAILGPAGNSESIVGSSLVILMNQA
jgi:hypothetical protein